MPEIQEIINQIKIFRNERDWKQFHTGKNLAINLSIEAAELLDGRPDAAQWVARMRDAALQDEQGNALEGAIKTIESFTSR